MEHRTSYFETVSDVNDVVPLVPTLDFIRATSPSTKSGSKVPLLHFIDTNLISSLCGADIFPPLTSTPGGFADLW